MSLVASVQKHTLTLPAATLETNTSYILLEYTTYLCYTNTIPFALGIHS